MQLWQVAALNCFVFVPDNPTRCATQNATPACRPFFPGANFCKVAKGPKSQNLGRGAPTEPRPVLKRTPAAPLAVGGLALSSG